MKPLRGNRIESDNHSHILAASIESMTTAAKKKGLEQFSITEHISQFKGARESIEFSSFHTKGRVFHSLDEYRSEFEKVKPAPDFRLKMGLEVDFISRFQKQIGDFVNQRSWDILLCSVHELSDRKDIEANINSDPRSTERRWREYVEIEIEALESDYIPFDVLTHPVRLFGGIGDFPRDEIGGLLSDLARSARRHSKALELNGKDLEINERLVEQLARAAAKEGCQVSFGSDAHLPTQIMENSPQAANLIERFGLELKF
jgi:HisJ family histidinol phosphate phosphatase